MPEPDFSVVVPHTLLRYPCSPSPADDDFDFRGLMLAAPARQVLTSPGPAGPLGSSPLRAVACGSLTLSILDQRRLAADGCRDPLQAVTIVISDPGQGLVAAGRLRMMPIRAANGLEPGISDDEAAGTTSTLYFNANLPDLLPMVMTPGTYQLMALLGEFRSAVVTTTVLPAA